MIGERFFKFTPLRIRRELIILENIGILLLFSESFMKNFGSRKGQSDIIFNPDERFWFQVAQNQLYVSLTALEILLIFMKYSFIKDLHVYSIIGQIIFEFVHIVSMFTKMPLLSIIVLQLWNAKYF